MVEKYRRKWNFIHPYRLSNRTIPRQISRHTNESNDESNTIIIGGNNRNGSNSSANQEENKLSSIEAAKLRFLQRKSLKK